MVALIDGIDDLAVQERVLTREAALGADHRERLGAIGTRRAELDAQLAALSERWEQEGGLVAEIRALRGKIEESFGAAPAADDLRALRAELAEKQGALEALQGFGAVETREGERGVLFMKIAAPPDLRPQVARAVVGAGLAFLWFNAPPAAVFMGDTGSLALGGALGTIAVVSHHEIVLGIIGGLFVAEALSVIIQVFFYKRTGRRVFRMAPIHHHFEQLGWSEPTVVIRFWIISLVLALAGLSTLKLR